MINRLGLFAIAGLLASASTGFAQLYTMELTGVGNGNNNGSVYYSPYQGTISLGNNLLYSGYMICDDFTTESFLDTPWTATETSAASLNGTEKFAGESYTVGGTTYNTTQLYNAISWLANQLLQPSNLSNSTIQGNISFAIWDIMDGTAATGDVLTDIQNAFAQVTSGYVGNNVEVFTPSPNANASQEFLVVNAPEASTPVLLAVDLLGFLTLVGFLRKRISRHI